MSFRPNPEGPDDDWYLWWLIFHRPPPPPPPWWDKVQIVIHEEELNKYFEKGFTFTTQLQSGAVIVTKTFSAEQIAKTGIEQLRAKALH